MKLKKIIKKLEKLSFAIEAKLQEADFVYCEEGTQAMLKNPDFYEFEESLAIITDLMDVLSNKIKEPDVY